MPLSSADDHAPVAPAATPSPDGAGTEYRVDLDQMFVLIEGILPFEACLYYQVLPLSIEGSCLNLGMVNPADQSAIDYVRRLVSYINCSLVPRPIASDWHRQVLSQFLSHSAKTRQPTAPPPPPSRPSARPPAGRAFQEQPTLVVGSPDDLGEGAAAAPPKPPAAPAPEPAASPSHLELSLKHREQPAAAKPLHQLSAKELTRELLSQVLQGGIGRLYLERQADGGRILSSRDGKMQSTLEGISPSLLQGVINELKGLMHLSLLTVRKTKQVEIERIYGHERILLRLRVLPGTHGEQATLQVLRGAALKFYQQQQQEKLGRDALGMAQKLQQQLEDIRRQSRSTLPMPAGEANTLPQIASLLKKMESQVQTMIELSHRTEQDFNDPE